MGKTNKLPKKRMTVLANLVIYNATCEIEAESLEDAIKAARALDPGKFLSNIPDSALAEVDLVGVFET